MMFDLRVIRWRWFELGHIWFLNPCQPNKLGSTISGEYITVTGNGGHNSGQAKTKDIKIWKGSWKKTASFAMGIDWMTWKELTQAIPPAYTKYIGEQIKINL